jgi:hypothetical protein
MTLHLDGPSDPPDVTDAIVALEYIQNDLRTIVMNQANTECLAHTDDYLPTICKGTPSDGCGTLPTIGGVRRIGGVKRTGGVRPGATADHMLDYPTRRRGVWYLVGLITRRSRVQISPPQFSLPLER